VKLWLVKARLGLPPKDDPWSPWYDKFSGFVIRAESELEASKLRAMKQRR
jgi:hypothetical protein